MTMISKHVVSSSLKVVNHRKLDRSFQNFCTGSNSFQCNDEYYLQVLGTAMGTKMAPSFASLCMDKLEMDFLGRVIKHL